MVGMTLKFRRFQSRQKKLGVLKNLKNLLKVMSVVLMIVIESGCQLCTATSAEDADNRILVPHLTRAHFVQLVSIV